MFGHLTGERFVIKSYREGHACVYHNLCSIPTEVLFVCTMMYIARCTYTTTFHHVYLLRYYIRIVDRYNTLALGWLGSKPSQIYNQPTPSLETRSILIVEELQEVHL